MTQANHKRQLKNFLINRKYQLRFTVFLVAVCAVLMVGLGYLVMDKLRAATKISINQLDENQAYVKDFDKEKQHLASRERLVQGVYVGTVVLVSVGLFMYGIILTHKAAGPLYKVSLYVEKVKAGRFDKVYGLRKGDHLVDFFDHFKEAHEALRGRQERDVAVLREVVAAAEAEGAATASAEVAAELEALKALLKSKEASLV